MTGYVYILSNPALRDDLLKIGMTTLTPEERAQELSRETAVAAPFEVEHSVQVPDCAAAESLIHTRLDRYRWNSRREFFELPLEVARREVDFIAAEVRRLCPPSVPERAGGASALAGTTAARGAL